MIVVTATAAVVVVPDHDHAHLVAGRALVLPLSADPARDKRWGRGWGIHNYLPGGVKVGCGVVWCARGGMQLRGTYQITYETLHILQSALWPL